MEQGMNTLRGRIDALERARAQPLPLYVLTLAGGERRTLDALEAVLYMAQLDAGLPVQPFTDVQLIRGHLPPGRAWETLERELLAHTIEARAGPASN